MKTLPALLLCLFGALATPLPAQATPGEVVEGALLRDAPMQGLTGPSRMLSDFRGKPLIVNMWASYCGPCLSEMGSLERLAQRYGKHFNIIGISIDDYPERAHAFLAQAKTSFPHFIDQRLALENLFGANRIPLTVLIDANGKVLHKVYGAREWDSSDTVKAIEQAFGLKL